jgi:predicted alpha/beta superfamily hydrolase
MKLIKKDSFQVNKRTLSLFTSEAAAPGPCIYVTMEPEEAEQLAEALSLEMSMKMPLANLSLAAIGGVDWNKELSPWPAPKAFRGGEDFGGGGPDYLREVIKELIPAVEHRLPAHPTCRVAAGYSLAGLWALYAGYQSRAFARIVCASASLWYDGFLEFLRTRRPVVLPERVYFSVGDKEKITKNQRLATVEDATRAAADFLASQGVVTTFELNPGGHFVDAEKRLARGIEWVLDFTQPG